MTIRTSGIMFLLLTLLSASAWAQGSGRVQRPRMTEGRAEFLKELQLTDEQKKEMLSIRFQAQKQFIAQRAAIATARLELRQLFRAPSPDQSAIEKKVKEVSELRTKASLARIGQLFSFRNILTPEQRSKVRDRMGQVLRTRRTGEMRKRLPGPEIRERIKERMERFKEFDPFER
ncbi:MAG: Spy/CpxP family protein refolding chaperone [Bacteroidota bacterium]